MPRVAPFRGLHYAHERFGHQPPPERVRATDDGDPPPGRITDLSDVACPPYDVIDADLQARLLARSEHNAVRVELSAEPHPHAAAAATLDAWLQSGVLERRNEPAVYYYRHGTAQAPGDLAVEGIVARLLLEPWGDGVRPHEHTMPGPKADRLALLRATRTQLSPILAVYFDRSERYRHVMSRAWEAEWRARDVDGILHQLCAVEADDRLLGHLARQTLFVADGHHRYETALAYQAEVRADPRHASAPPGALAADWIMVVLANAELTELEIRPTHRLLLDADAAALRALVRDGASGFRATPMAADDLPAALDERRDAEAPTFGIALASGEAALLEGDATVLASRLREAGLGHAVAALDLSALHVAILDDRLGISAVDVAAGQRLAYTRDEADARARVARGEAVAAVLVRPTRLDQLADVAAAGDVMPQKSTYFYPKLLTGMVFNPLEDR